MKLMGGIALLCAGLSAQTASNLGATLAALNNPKASVAVLTQQLVNEMTAMSPADRKPARGTLAGFASDFTAALLGKDLTAAQRNTLQTSIAKMLSGDGTNSKPAGLLREILVAAGAGAARTHRIVTDFIAIGEQVRGPDDAPILPQKAGR